MSPEHLHAILTANQQALEQLQKEITDLRAEHEDLKRRYELAISRIDDHLEVDWATQRELEEVRLRIHKLKP